MHIKFGRELCLALSSAFMMVAVSSAGQAASITVGGAGIDTDCAKLLEWKEKDKTAYEAAVQWEFGYLSGAAAYGPRKVNPLKGMEFDEVSRWFDNYCRNHLEQTIKEVADQFIRQH